ncbi:2,6-dihydroxypyridine 3-monooxygenase [Tolypocladium ophioglossoides CBS 100239]|uniref:2,6-dihydroxypyridine 3-monooxygenase n=1 Tax=Tolypocladium ophioglossoides (strain CBS 100239) TaxID=1163406 RepID=A0A0L0N429_TOLOC|nr:2,6-dihydroxypyridine 3-monooxygenase [Tolypocladium ophioglossoides CBS 100239]
MEIIIIGGSICGLLFGIICKGLGHSVQVLERWPTPFLSPRGAGIVLGESVESFFALFGGPLPLPSVRNSHRVFLDRRGGTLRRIERDQNTTSWELLYYSLRRLFDGLPSNDSGATATTSPGTSGARYRFGCEASSIALHEHGQIEVGLATPAKSTEAALADLVVAADGFNSTVRKIMLPGVVLDYAGYIALRGTVPERDLSDAVVSVCVGSIVFYNGPGIQAVAYAIPGPRGLSEPGDRLVNWVWYQNCPAGSDQDREMMTDIDGTVHRTTVPPGKLNQAVWSRQLRRAKTHLPPQFAEMMEKTAKPFVQKIMDAAVPKCAFRNGKVLLAGDAAFGLRPHTGSSTDQAAFQALKLAELLRGLIDIDQWESAVVHRGMELHRIGVQIGMECGLGSPSGLIVDIDSDIRAA